MLDKLTEEQREELAELCNRIDDLFAERDNGFNEDNIEEYYESNLYRGIQSIMVELGQWG